VQGVQCSGERRHQSVQELGHQGVHSDLVDNKARQFIGIKVSGFGFRV
jgi:hypothetical protein